MKGTKYIQWELKHKTSSSFSFILKYVHLWGGFPAPILFPVNPHPTNCLPSLWLPVLQHWAHVLHNYFSRPFSSYTGRAWTVVSTALGIPQMWCCQWMNELELCIFLHSEYFTTYWEWMWAGCSGGLPTSYRGQYLSYPGAVCPVLALPPVCPSIAWPCLPHPMSSHCKEGTNFCTASTLPGCWIPVPFSKCFHVEHLTRFTKGL